MEASCDEDVGSGMYTDLLLGSPGGQCDVHMSDVPMTDANPHWFDELLHVDHGQRANLPGANPADGFPGDGGNANLPPTPGGFPNAACDARPAPQPLQPTPGTHTPALAAGYNLDLRPYSAGLPQQALHLQPNVPHIVTNTRASSAGIPVSPMRAHVSADSPMHPRPGTLSRAEQALQVHRAQQALSQTGWVEGLPEYGALTAVSVPPAQQQPALAGESSASGECIRCDGESLPAEMEVDLLALLNDEDDRGCTAPECPPAAIVRTPQPLALVTHLDAGWAVPSFAGCSNDSLEQPIASHGAHGDANPSQEPAAVASLQQPASVSEIEGAGLAEYAASQTAVPTEASAEQTAVLAQRGPAQAAALAAGSTIPAALPVEDGTAQAAEGAVTCAGQGSACRPHSSEAECRGQSQALGGGVPEGPVCSWGGPQHPSAPAASSQQPPQQHDASTAPSTPALPEALTEGTVAEPSAPSEETHTAGPCGVQVREGSCATWADAQGMDGRLGQLQVQNLQFADGCQTVPTGPEIWLPIPTSESLAAPQGFPVQSPSRGPTASCPLDASVDAAVGTRVTGGSTLSPPGDCGTSEGLEPPSAQILPLAPEVGWPPLPQALPVAFCAHPPPPPSAFLTCGCPPCCFPTS